MNHTNGRLNFNLDAEANKATVKPLHQSICKNPLFKNVKFKDGTEDTGFCEDTGGTQPIWVADVCESGNGNGFGHKVGRHPTSTLSCRRPLMCVVSGGGGGCHAPSRNEGLRHPPQPSVPSRVGSKPPHLC